MSRNLRLFRLFEELADPGAPGRLEAWGMRLGTLFVRVESPHLLERCRYLKRQWIRDLNVEMGEDVVTEIVFKVLPPGSDFPEAHARGEDEGQPPDDEEFW
jgi:hypothetical protein